MGGSLRKRVEVAGPRCSSLINHHQGEKPVTYQLNHSNPLHPAVKLLLENGFDGIADALTILMNEAMSIERDAFLQADPHQRTDQRRGYANGFKPKTYATRTGSMQLRIPQARDLDEGLEPFYPNALERGARSERALKIALAEMYVQGVSTRKVRAITEELCGFEVTSMQVSRATKLLDKELGAWRARELGECPYLVLDARYEKIRHGGAVRDCAVLIALGVRKDGKRSILGVSVSLSEAEVHWREFLKSLQDRGLHGVKLITSDNHAGLKKAVKARFGSNLWQRCQFHLQQNANSHIPRREMQGQVSSTIRQIFRADSREDADEMLRRAVSSYEKKAPGLSAWMEKNIPEGLSVLEIPSTHRTRMRTTNGFERLNKEIKRRTRVATLFPNEESLLRLVSAILVETSDEWETGKTYLLMEGI
jgi:transposase-like protein